MKLWPNLPATAFGLIAVAFTLFGTLLPDVFLYPLPGTITLLASLFGYAGVFYCLVLTNSDY
jgi:hypothetical protein